MNEPIEPIESTEPVASGESNEPIAPVRHITLNVRYYRKIAAEAPHSVRWYRTVIAVGWNVIPVEIISTLLILLCDFVPAALGLPAADLAAGLLPGSMAAHLYFVLMVRNAALLGGSRVLVILAHIGALAFAAVHFCAASDTWFPFFMKRYAYLIFAEAGVTGAAAWLFIPHGGIAFPLAVVGTVLRIGLGAFLFYLEACVNWGDRLETAVRVIWAAETRHWPDDFILDENVGNEEWMRLRDEYDEAHRKRRPARKKRNFLH